MVAKRHESLACDGASEVLSQKLTFPTSKRVAKNRFMKAPLTERTSSWDPENPEKCGIPHQGLFNLYRKWSHGGFGLIVTGNMLVCPKHLEAAGNTIVHESIDSPERREAFKQMAEAMKSGGALAIAQLSHGGRQTPITINKTPVAPSEIQIEGVRNGNTYGKPIELTKEQIHDDIIKNFAYAAKYCYEAGFYGVELPVAHGFIFAQFLSPNTNKRTDEYGGSLENRVRIVFDVYDAIRRAVPEETGFMVGVKMNSVEFQGEGLSKEDTGYVADRIEKAGFDFIQVTGGMVEQLAPHVRESTKQRESFFLEFAGEIKQRVKKPVIYITGGFRTAYWMEKAIRGGFTDGIGIGRPAAAEPDLPNKILSGRVDAAIHSLLDQSDFGITVMAGNTQMYQAGLNEHVGDEASKGIMDLSDQNVVDKYCEAVQRYFAKIGEIVSSGKAVEGVLELLL